MDEHLQPVSLRGLSLFWSQWSPHFYSEVWVHSAVRYWGANVIRAALGVTPDGYLDNPSVEIKRIDTVVSAAIAHGIYVIIDWHAHEKYANEALEFFTYICLKYKEVPNLILELWNEPGSQYGWESDILPYHLHLVDSLREVGFRGIFICGTEDHCRGVDVASEAPIPRENICYGLHFYSASHREGLRQRARNAIAMGLCLFASEYGLCDSSGDGEVDLDEMQRWWQFLDLHNISNLNWALNDKAEAASALASPKAFRLGPQLTRSGKAVRRYLKGG